MMNEGARNMDGNTIPVGEGITVIVKASGDLFLQGEEQMEVRFQSSEDHIRVNQSNETLYVETHASLDLAVPRRLNVIVEKVGGSAFLQDLENSLVIQKVGGDLAARRVSALRIEKVGGGCQIDEVRQGLTINKVGGDLIVRNLTGPIEVSSIGGRGDLQVIDGSVTVSRAGGDLQIYLAESLPGPVDLRAGGNVELYLPARVNAHFNLDSGGETIEIELSEQSQAIDEDIESRRYEFSLGEGGPGVEARAGGDITITDRPAEPEPITESLNRRENAWVEARDRRGHPSWSGGFGFDRTSAWADMISRRAQEAARRAEQRAHRAMRRTEEQIRTAAEREMHRAESRGFGHPFPHGEHHPGRHPEPPQPPRSPVTEQERLMVLQMLQDGKITVEQAETLLAALEGRSKA
jgi:hypothetical protein